MPSTPTNNLVNTNQLCSSLDKIDWSFPGASTPSSSIHSFHWFPGNFIPQIPSYLIQILTKEGDLIYDPFCGSGTTGIEAALLGRNSVQSDINLASLQVTRGKLALLFDTGFQTCAEAFLEELVWDFIPPDFEPILSTVKGSGNVENWFHPETLAQLRYLWYLTCRTKQTTFRSALELVFTDVLFTCVGSRGSKTATGAPRRHHWGWIADNVLPRQTTPHNAISIFRERLFSMCRVVNTMPTSAKGKSSVLHSNVTDCSLVTDSIDCIVTSPPYVGMIDYTLANRLTFEWMGWDMKKGLKQEIGARRHRNRTTALSDYLQLMESAFWEFQRILRPGGYLAIVIGSSRKFPNALAEIESLFRRHFTIVWGPYERESSRRRVSGRQNSPTNERVYVLRNS